MLNIWKPEAFHGAAKKSNYFEGWYFKSVDKSEKTAYAIIPGISLSKDPSRSHAFILLFDARNHRIFYFRYSLSDFSAKNDTFEVHIGKSFFSLYKIKLDIDDGATIIRGELAFSHIYPWPVKLLSPGAMGWYAFVPRMECYHGVLSLDHGITGYVEINGDRSDFTGGKGYMEKDWGVSMPSSWIWMQSNHFSEDGVSLFGSIAKIPWRGASFTGYIFGFLFRNRLHAFTGYGGARITALSVTDATIRIVLENEDYQLDIHADRAEGVDLPAPSLGEMTAKVNESLRAKINVEFYQKTMIGRNLIYSGTGRNSGLELVGNVDELLGGIAKS